MAKTRVLKRSITAHIREEDEDGFISVDPNFNRQFLKGTTEDEIPEEYLASIGDHLWVKDGEDPDAPASTSVRIGGRGYLAKQRGGTHAAGAVVAAEDEDEVEDEDLWELTVADLHERASELEIEGRSSMNKEELIEAIENATDG